MGIFFVLGNFWGLKGMEKKKKVAVLAQGVGGYHSGPFNLYKFISELKYLTFF